MDKPHLRVEVCKLPHFMGGSIGPRTEICETSDLPIPMVPHLHQSNGYTKRKLQIWRAQKCIGLVGAEIVLTSAGLQITPFHRGQYRVGNGNMRNFDPHGTVFAAKESLYQNKSMGMKSSKMYCPSRCRNCTYKCWATPSPFFLAKERLYRKKATGMKS